MQSECNLAKLLQLSVIDLSGLIRGGEGLNGIQTSSWEMSLFLVAEHSVALKMLLCLVSLG